MCYLCLEHGKLSNCSCQCRITSIDVKTSSITFIRNFNGIQSIEKSHLQCEQCGHYVTLFSMVEQKLIKANVD